MYPVDPFPITVTALYASLLALLFLLIAVLVARYRVKQDVLIGDEGSPRFKACVRAQTYLMEYGPMALLLLLIAELNGMSGLFLHAVAATFVAGQFSHCYGLIRAEGDLHPARLVGTLVSWGCLMGLTCANLLYALYILE